MRSPPLPSNAAGNRIDECRNHGPTAERSDNECCHKHGGGESIDRSQPGQPCQAMGQNDTGGEEDFIGKGEVKIVTSNRRNNGSIANGPLDDVGVRLLREFAGGRAYQLG